ncbi:urea ABC transporter permease subunit UrtC [Alsobacter sp. R-9]
MTGVLASLRSDTLLASTLAAILAVAAVILAVGGLAGPGLLSPYLVNAIGQLAAFALLALSLDLIWGYLGILSLGHGVFFAIGGYAIAMYLLKHSFVVTGVVPDFMQFMGWKALPAYWWGFESFPYALVAGLLVTLIVAFAIGYTSFRSRVGGVYFAIVTQALVYVAMLLMFRNDTGFGGNNGMTGWSLVLGFPVGSPQAAAGLAFVSLVVLFLALLCCFLMTRGQTGRLMLACRDDEARLRTLGYETLSIKLRAWCLSALLAALAGILYVPQVGIINPRVLSPELSLEIAVWVAIGGRGRLAGAVIGAVLINGLKFWLSSAAPDLWPFILAALIVIVALAFPNGLIDLPKLRQASLPSLGDRVQRLVRAGGAR